MQKCDRWFNLVTHLQGVVLPTPKFVTKMLLDLLVFVCGQLVSRAVLEVLVVRARACLLRTALTFEVFDARFESQEFTDLSCGT